MSDKDSSILWELYLKESPYSFPNVPNDFNDKMEAIAIADIKKFKYIGVFEDYQIYEHFLKNEVELYFIFEDLLVAFYSYTIRSNQPIKTKMIWNNDKYSGSFRKIFGEYIIPKFKIVESDDSMSNLGFNMWMKLIGFYPNYKFYAKTQKGLIPMTEPHDVYSYKNKITDPDSSFIVEYSNIES
jgi:hypothetical protein